MGLLLNLLGAPLMGPVKLVQWLGEKVQEVADQQMGDADKLKSELIELQMLHEMGDVTQEEHDKREKEITDLLNSLKKKKEGG
ncbi:MAG: gas vesicle protein GvpG [Pseudomonadota bacterium]